MDLAFIIIQTVIFTKETGTNMRGMGKAHTHTSALEQNLKVRSSSLCMVQFLLLPSPWANVTQNSQGVGNCADCLVPGGRCGE